MEPLNKSDLSSGNQNPVISLRGENAGQSAAEFTGHSETESGGQSAAENTGQSETENGGQFRRILHELGWRVSSDSC